MSIQSCMYASRRSMSSNWQHTTTNTQPHTQRHTQRRVIIRARHVPHSSSRSSTHVVLHWLPQRVQERLTPALSLGPHRMRHVDATMRGFHYHVVDGHVSEGDHARQSLSLGDQVAVHDVLTLEVDEHRVTVGRG